MLQPREIKKLYKENKAVFRKMDRVAGNMVKGLLFEIQDLGRNTYIRLTAIEGDKFAVDYEIVQGDAELVKKMADTLGFKSWDENRLEVYHG